MIRAGGCEKLGAVNNAAHHVARWQVAVRREVARFAAVEAPTAGEATGATATAAAGWCVTVGALIWAVAACENQWSGHAACQPERAAYQTNGGRAGGAYPVGHAAEGVLHTDVADFTADPAFARLLLLRLLRAVTSDVPNLAARAASAWVPAPEESHAVGR